ncbi:phosphoribosylglycinamide formyltransferase [Parabacteroides sp. PF5-6]|uniref:phosphoribosylglycinamide formyltransferase n=1 Tax=Parabacteroides sp. PF5-6 TaxID=1742403 RepID=UPI002406076F|nr:phosphoribosylglycinamide formyltransferase [Parabacteroides sp. PF5-6]MDF9830490.1 phosphoribosylglycinamide formyltransferase-1 [Parabacteroides sp. PF5-6]
MKNIAIFASGSGTNAENIIKYFANHPHIRVAVVLSNNANAGVHERAKKLGVPSFTFSRADFEEGFPVLKILAEYQVDFIVLAGFLNIISEAFLNAYPEKVINIHPALLPKHGGKGMYGMRVHEAVVAAKDKKTGITIHYINEYYDDGEIIFQADCPVSAQDTPETVAQKVHILEYEHFPHVIEELLS